MTGRRTRDYKKVRKEGGSVVLTVGKLIPDTWVLVSIDVEKCKLKDVRILKVTRVA